MPPSDADANRAKRPWGIPAAMLIILVLLLVLSARHGMNWARLLLSGVEATATVTERDTTKSYKYLRYRFALPDGRTVDGTGKVSWKTYRALKEGDEARVLYLPSDPSVNGLHMERFKELVRVALAGVFFVGFAGIYLQRHRKRIASLPAAS